MSEVVVVSASLDGGRTEVEAYKSYFHTGCFVLSVLNGIGSITLTKDEVKALIDGLHKLIGEGDV